MRAIASLLAVAVFLVATPAGAQSRSAHGKLFPPQDLGLLANEVRELRQALESRG